MAADWITIGCKAVVLQQDEEWNNKPWCGVGHGVLIEDIHDPLGSGERMVYMRSLTRIGDRTPGTWGLISNVGITEFA